MTYEKRHGVAYFHLNFSHSTYGIPNVKFYSVQAEVVFPKLSELSKELCTIVPVNTAISANIGYLFPSYKTYKEWRVAEDDSDEYVNSVIEEISNGIHDNVLPLLERHTCLKQLLYDIVNAKMPKGWWYDTFCLPPILYYAEGNATEAQAYMEQMMQQLLQTDEAKRPRHPHQYQDFVLKFSDYMKRHQGLQI